MSDRRTYVPFLSLLPPGLRGALERAFPFIATDVFAQLVRFACAGLGVTLFSVSVYSFTAAVLHIAPLIANTISYGFGLAAGYAIHSRWSFSAGAESKAEEAGMFGRFLAASLFGFALNSFWVWLTTHFLHLSPLAPVPMMMFVTPLLSFLLNRYWVFRVA